MSASNELSQNDTTDESAEYRYCSSIFDDILNEMDIGKSESEHGKMLENTEPQDITETVHLDLNDENIDKANCSLIAYGLHVDEDDVTTAYNPKNNPDKAVDIVLEYPENGLCVEIFLDTESREWDSWINGKEGKLSPEQMQTFFDSVFFEKMRRRLKRDWPCNGDKMFSELMEALYSRKYRIDGFSVVENQDCEFLREEDDDVVDKIERHKHNVKLGKPNEKDRNGMKIRSSSGRKLINFSDMGVNESKYEAYYSWPGASLMNGNIEDTDEKTLKKVFKWSRWCDWEKQRPFLRARFAYNVAGGSASPDIIGISLSLQPNEDKNRGWKSYDVSLQPQLQYLTPQETQDILGLTIMRRFLKECLKRMDSILKIKDEEIFRLVNRPDKCSLDDIRKTKRIIKNTLRAVRVPTADTFIYT